MEKNMNSLGGGFGSASCSDTLALIAAPAFLHEPEQRTPQNILDEKISNIFLTIGIPVHISGYHYLREAVKLTAGNFEMVGSITTKLYPQVASHFNTSTCKVARGIHNAIEIAWKKEKIVNINTIFGFVVFEQNEKPSNGELIALLAERIYLDSI